MQQTMSLDSVIEMGRRGDPVQFIGVASAVLEQGVACDDLRLLLMQRLVGRGLIYRAQACAEGLSDAVRSHPEFSGMRHTLSATTNNGLIPQSSLSPCFNLNLAALRRRYAWADQVAATWKTQRHHIEFHTTSDGQRQIYDRRGHPGGGWRPLFGDHTPDPPVDELRSQLQNQVMSPLVIQGAGLGAYLPWLHEATADTFLGASAVIYQVEPSYLGLAVAMHLSDWRGPLSDDRVRVCCGPDACRQLEQLAMADAWNVPPVSAVQTAPWESDTAADIGATIEDLHARAKSERAALQESVHAAYRGRDGLWWKRRYKEALGAKGPPLRVLGVTSRFTTVLQYAMRDTMNALTAVGCETRVLIEPTGYARIADKRKLDEIRRFEPDLILLIDHTRRGQRAGMIENVPFLTWVQDRLDWLFHRETGAAMGPLDFCMGLNRDELVEKYGYPPERFLACEMATDGTALRAGSDGEHPQNDADSSDEPDARLACDVAFATNYSDRPDRYREACIQWKPEWKTLLDAIHDELSARAARSELNGALNAHHFLGGLEQDLGTALSAEQRTDLLQEYVWPLADRLIRLQTIDWAARWAKQTGRRFHLYGKGWEARPAYASYARGFLDHGPELGRAFRSAKINLHAGMNQAFHQRVLDGLAAGGFFLIRQHANDAWYRFRTALRQIVSKKGLRPGDTIGLDDLPEALHADWIADRKMRGVPARERYSVGPVEIYGEVDPQATPIARSPMQVWPDLDKVTFGSFEALADRLEWFIGHDDERHAIARSMRQGMLETFSYQALMKRLLSWLTETLGRA